MSKINTSHKNTVFKNILIYNVISLSRKWDKTTI